MELELRSNRSGVGGGSVGADFGKAERPDFRRDINQPHLIQAQPASPRRRAHPHRPRHQPQHRAHPLLLHHHVHLLRRLPARLRRGPGRLPGSTVLPDAPPPGSARRRAARSPRRQVLG